MGLVPRLVCPVRRDLGDFAAHLARLGFAPATIIDVGVADGTLELYAPFPRAKLVLVEPIAEFRRPIEQILTRYHGEVHFVAAGAAEGEAHFVTWNRAGDLHGARFVSEGGGATRAIPVRRLDALCADCPGPILLKVDVEGFELEVMKGADGLLDRIEVVVLETRLFEVEPGQAQLHEVVDYMRSLGYVVYDILATHARPLDGALVLCDLAFVKIDGALRRDKRYAAPEQVAAFEKSFIARLRHALGV